MSGMTPRIRRCYAPSAAPRLLSEPSVLGINEGVEDTQGRVDMPGAVNARGGCSGAHASGASLSPPSMEPEGDGFELEL
jgi:hypothetical protein